MDANDVICEDFLDFATAERITGQELAALILGHIEKWGLDLQDCRGQGYDGASNMSGSRGGVQAIIARQNPKAIYVHCNSHVLNLCIVKTCQIATVKDMNGIMTDLAEFFWNSPKRQRLFERVLEKEAPDASKTRLKSLCRTRWVERHEAYETFCELYIHVVKVLEVMTSHLFEEEYGHWAWDSETRTVGSGLLSRVTSFPFIVAFLSTMKVLAFVKPISTKLQKRCNDVIRAYRMVDEAMQELKDLRETGDATFHAWFTECEQLAADVGIEPAVPRTVSRQRHRCNVPYSTPQDYYRRAIFLPLVDHIAEEMATRFGPLQQKAAALFALVPSVVAGGSKYETAKAYNDLKEEWSDDLPCPTVFDTEWMRWVKKWQGTGLGKPDNLQEAIKSCDKDIFPNIYTLLRLACTIPVTSAETERCNSALKALKTKTRNSMTETRLTSLSILKIHYGRPVDIPRAVDTFASQNPRRMRMSIMDQ